MVSAIEHDKNKGRAVVAAYVREYPGDVPMADLRSYVRSETGIKFGGPTLATFLKSLGFVREGERRIDTCPGKTVFYVLPAAPSPATYASETNKDRNVREEQPA